MKRFVGWALLAFWIPLILAVSFPESASGWYTISGFIMGVFGTWAGILLVRSKK